jgi:transcriptional regulator with XRE-family HTH domain
MYWLVLVYMETENHPPHSWDNLSYAALCACLKKAQQDSGVSVKELSDQLNKRYPTIVDLLNGKLRNPQLDTIESICGALGLSLSFELRPAVKRKRGRQWGPGNSAPTKEKSPGE